MTNQEFSNEFDVLYNNITSNQAPGLNEYEKSVFLTKAQDQLVNEYFNARVDSFGGGYDGSQKRQYDFSTLTKVSSLYDIDMFGVTSDNMPKLDSRSKVFIFPDDYHLSVNEIILDKSMQYSVIPLTHIEYLRLMSKPYNLPLKRQAWRLFTDKYTNRVFSSTNIKLSIPSTRYLSIKLKVTNDYNTFIETLEPDDDSVSADYNNTIVGVTSRFLFIEGQCIVEFNIEGNTLRINLHTNVPQNNLKYCVQLLQNLFKMLLYCMNLGYWNSEYDNFMCVDIAKNTGGFSNCSILEDVIIIDEYNLNTYDDIQVPKAEIIGKFKDDPKYQLRYVRTIKPIILVDLDDYGEQLSIDGYSKVTECELPRECHQEILERAVTLAKIAWQGATATQVANQQRESR